MFLTVQALYLLSIHSMDTPNALLFIPEVLLNADKKDHGKLQTEFSRNFL